MPRTDTRHDPGTLMTLAAKKGYALDVSALPDRWRLVGNDLQAVTAKDGSTELTSVEAKDFLVRQPDE